MLESFAISHLKKSHAVYNKISFFLITVASCCSHALIALAKSTWILICWLFLSGTLIMSFLNNVNVHDPTGGNCTSASTSRRPSTLKLSCDSTVSSSTTGSEWTTCTEILPSPADPFGDQSANATNALISDNGPTNKRTIIRKVGLKRNNKVMPNSQVSATFLLFSIENRFIHFAVQWL